MINETKLQQDEARAARAQKLIEDEILTAAFSDLKSAYLTQWEATTVDQDALREKYWLAHRIVGVVQNHLSTVVANGSLARAELNNLATLAERRKAFGTI